MLFRGTAHPFGRSLPAEPVCDAIVISVSNKGSDRINLPLAVRYRSNTGEGDQNAYLSLESRDSEYVVAPMVLEPGAVQSVLLEAQASHDIRIDFPDAFHVDELTLFSADPTDLGTLEFHGVTSLHRDGARHYAELDTAGAHLARLFEALRVYVPELQHVDVFESKNATPTQPSGAKGVSLAVRETMIRKLVAGLPLEAPPNLLAPLLDGCRCACEPLHPAYIRDILVLMTLCALRQGEWLFTKVLASFRPWLSSKAQIDLFMARLNELAADRPELPDKFVIAKQSINPSWLEVRKDKYLSLLDRLFDLAPALGIEAVLSYGTLLGAARGGGFIPHDDDVDVLYWDASRSREEALMRRDALIGQLEGHGFSVRVDPDLLNVNLIFDGASCDLFPCWLEGDELRLLMRYYQLESIDKEIIFPRNGSSIRLYDRIFPAPARIDAFLHARYGPSWNVPQMYFEWPWQLDDQC